MTVGYRFKEALMADGLSVIAEVKRQSPSKGVLRAGADPAELACQYRDGGAVCLSVLTDAKRFGGSPEDLKQAQAAAGIPVLRKDFLGTEKDVYDTHEMGADAMLLIVPDVEASVLRPVQELALSLGVDVLMEIRTEEELETAVSHGAYMIAVNQRDDPKDAKFTVQYDKAVRMAGLMSQLPDHVVKVAASGIGVPGGTEMADLAAVGYDAALIGEALVTSSDPTATLKSLLAAASSLPLSG